MKRYLPGIAAMIVVVVLSNILVQHLVGQWLTWGAFTYPLAFLVTDLMNRLYGAQAARRVIYAGFFAGVVCSVIGSQIQGEFGALVSLRVAIASGAAFLCAQLTDVTVFNALRRFSWWKAPLIGSFVGSCVDTALFFSIAFSAQLAFLDPSNDVSWANEGIAILGFGPVAPLWVSLALADWGVKVAIAVLALTPYRMIVWKKSPRVG